MTVHPYTQLFQSAIAPDVSFDVDAGYEIGDWVHVTGGSIWACRDASAGAAVWEEQNTAGVGGAVDSVNGQTGAVVLDADDISDTSTTHKFTTAADITKLAGIATGATAYTDEQAQDAVGAMIADTNTIDLTYTDATPELKADVKTQMSLTSDASGIKLSGDATTPGNNKVYGTDGSGTKGWKADPSGTGSGDYATLLSAVMDYMAGNNTDPIDTKLTQGSYVALLYFGSHDAASWKAATNAVHTVTTGKTFVVIYTHPSNAQEIDPGNRRLRLWNTTDSSVVLDYADFARGFVVWNGDLGTASKLANVAATKAIRLEIWNSDGNRRAMGGFLIGKEV